jgi:hypothetical protein
MNIIRVIRSFKEAKPVYEKRYLFSFLISLCLSIVLIFTLILTAAVNDNKFVYFSEKNLEQLSRFSEIKKGSDISLVLLGDSRLRHALREGFEPEKKIRLESGKDVVLLQFAVNAAQYMDFHSMSSDILEAKPDFLFIGRQILSNARASEQKPVIYSRLVYSYLENLIKRPDEISLKKLWKEDRSGLEECFDELTVSMMKTRLEATRNRDHHSLNLSENRNLKLLREFLDSALKNGIKVVVYHIYPNNEILEHYGVPLHELDAQGLGFMPEEKELLPNNYDKVRWVQYKPPTDKRYYCDFVHLNHEGRVLFKGWFENVLENLSQ